MKKIRKYLLEASLKTYRTSWSGNEFGQYDPKYYDIEEDVMDYEDERDNKKYHWTKDRILRKKEFTWSLPAKEDKDVIFRGMNATEFENILKTGLIKSNSSYNIGPDQAGLTYYTTDPRSAVSYANGFAPGEHKPTFDKPAYVIAVKKPSPENIKNVKGTGSHEIGVKIALPAKEILKVYKGNVVSYIPEINERGIRVSAQADLVWEDITDKVKTRLRGKS